MLKGKVYKWKNNQSKCVNNKWSCQPITFTPCWSTSSSWWHRKRKVKQLGSICHQITTKFRHQSNQFWGKYKVGEYQSEWNKKLTDWLTTKKTKTGPWFCDFLYESYLLEEFVWLCFLCSTSIVYAVTRWLSYDFQGQGIGWSSSSFSKFSL